MPGKQLQWQAQTCHSVCASQAVAIVVGLQQCTRQLVWTHGGRPCLSVINPSMPLRNSSSIVTDCPPVLWLLFRMHILQHERLELNYATVMTVSARAPLKHMSDVESCSVSFCSLQISLCRRRTLLLLPLLILCCGALIIRAWGLCLLHVCQGVAGVAGA